MKLKPGDVVLFDGWENEREFLGVVVGVQNFGIGIKEKSRLEYCISTDAYSHVYDVRLSREITKIGVL